MPISRTLRALASCCFRFTSGNGELLQEPHWPSRLIERAAFPVCRRSFATSRPPAIGEEREFCMRAASVFPLKPIAWHPAPRSPQRLTKAQNRPKVSFYGNLRPHWCRAYPLATAQTAQVRLTQALPAQLWSCCEKKPLRLAFETYGELLREPPRRPRHPPPRKCPLLPKDLIPLIQDKDSRQW